MSAIHNVENGQWLAAETLSSVFQSQHYLLHFPDHFEARLNCNHGRFSVRKFIFFGYMMISG